MRNKGQLPIEENIYGVRPSQVDGATLGEFSRKLQAKEKRSFFYQNWNLFLVSTTVTSYFFTSTVITKPVTLGTAGDGTPLILGSVLCLPAGYSVC